MPQRVIVRGAAAAALAVLLSACASPTPPSLVQARGEVNDAVNAPPDSYAHPQLDEARMKLGQAEAAAQKDDMAQAGRLAEESLADLHLSRSLASADHSVRAESSMQATIDSLKGEANQSATLPAGGRPAPLAPTQPAPPAPAPSMAPAPMPMPQGTPDSSITR